MNEHITGHAPCPTCYQVARCRCPECRIAQRRYRKRREYDLQHGRPRLVDATPARDHALKLMEFGMTLKAVAEAAGMPRGSLTNLVRSVGGRPRTRRVAPATAERILAVRYDPRAAFRVDATGTTRRVRDLALQGFTTVEIAARIGTRRGNIVELRAGRWATVIPALADAIRDAHPALSASGPNVSTPRQQTRARLAAERAGWVRLGYYDDPDNPHCKPAREVA